MEGSLAVVGGSLELEQVDERVVALPGGTSRTLANRAVLKVKAFGLELTLGWEEQYPMEELFTPQEQEDAGWAWLRRHETEFAHDLKYTGEIPGRIGGKVGGTIWIGGSIGAWIELLEKE
jgi:hypothetical protein